MRVIITSLKCKFLTLIIAILASLTFVFAGFVFHSGGESAPEVVETADDYAPPPPDTNKLQEERVIKPRDYQSKFIPPPRETPVEEEKETKKQSSKYRLTAYCACEICNGKWAGQTATGVVPKEGRTIAVDPKVIPYGTHVIIYGHEYVAEDCGGGIKGNRIDIFFESHQAANDFGVRYADVCIVN